MPIVILRKKILLDDVLIDASSLAYIVAPMLMYIKSDMISDKYCKSQTEGATVLFLSEAIETQLA